MKKVFIPFKYFILAALLTCCSQLTKAVCLTNAQWNYSNPTGDSVVFNGADTFSQVHHLWIFGDGSIDSSGAIVSHVYSSPGVYAVCQYVSIPNSSCADTFCRSIVVGDTCRITARWTYTAPGGDSLRFTAADTFATATHVWNFGDGGIAYGTTAVTHRYATSGAYHVCFYVSRPGTTCSDSVCEMVTVTDDTCGISALWSYSALGGDTILFTAVDTSAGLHYVWSYGDGHSASGSGDTAHVYTHSGFYTACLHVTKPGTNCADSVCQTITVGSNPCGIDAAWTYTAHGGDSARFIAADTNSAASHQWSYGDGSFASGVNTSHHYASPGTYHVCFYVYIPNTACSDSFCQNVTITSDTCGLNPGCYSYALSGDSIRFIALDTNSTAHHIFSFGDGTVASGATDTVHTYAAAGTYTVCYYVYLPGTGCSDSLCQTVTVGAPPCPVTASWTAYGLGGDSVAFYADDTVPAATHIWNFGDGSYAYGTTAITHTFAAAGTYHVCFFAYEAGTACSDSFCQNITITIDTCHITSAWSATALGGDSARFMAADTNSTAHHIWSFGDGTYADTFSTDHIYSAAGVYHVCLYVYKPGAACSDSLCKDVTVTAALPCTLTAAWTSATAGNDSVRFTASDTSSAAHHVWNFGDGTIVSGISTVIHHYSSAGIYQVCYFTYIPNTNCADSLCRTVTVTGSTPCNIAAAWTATIIGNDSIKCTASDTNASANHIWKFGDGTIATGTTHVIHHYTSAGTYNVCFYVYEPGTNCSDSLCQNVTVTGSAPCTLSAAWTSTSVGTDSIKFIASDTNHAAHHIWSFGDGTSVSGSTDTVHHYAAPGAYNVCFYVYIPNTNCADSLCETVNVALGIDELSGTHPAITVVPNPFNQSAVIKVEGMLASYEIKIYDMLGKMVRHDVSAANTFNIERGNLSAGMYMYEVQLRGATAGKGKIIAE